MFDPRILTDFPRGKPVCPFCQATARPLLLCPAPGVSTEWLQLHNSSGETIRHAGRAVGFRAMMCEKGHTWLDSSVSDKWPEIHQ